MTTDLHHFMPNTRNEKDMKVIGEKRISTVFYKKGNRTNPYQQIIEEMSRIHNTSDDGFRAFYGDPFDDRTDLIHSKLRYLETDGEDFEAGDEEDEEFSETDGEDFGEEEDEDFDKEDEKIEEDDLEEYEVEEEEKDEDFDDYDEEDEEEDEEEEDDE